MKYFLYGNSGGIEKVAYDLSNPDKKTYGSIKEAFEAVVKFYDLCSLRIEDLSIEYYTYDDRIRKEVYIVLMKQCAGKKCDPPQYAMFMVETE